MTRHLLKNHPALESVQHQTNPVLFKALALEFNSILQLQKPSVKDVESLPISDIVFKHTGMRIEFKCEPVLCFNAYVIPPEISQNHVLLIDWLKQWYSNDTSLKALRTLKSKKLEASIDRKNGRVSGFFSELPVVVALNLGCFYTILNITMTGEEIAAILLHELGHLFGWYELLANQVTTNQALRAVKETFLNSNDKTLRVEILKEVDAAIGTRITDKDISADTIKDESSLYAVLLKAQVEKSRSELGSTIYDQRGFEYLADQFATRLGAGVHLATGLDKLYRSGWHPSYRAMFTFLITELISFTGFLVMSAVTWGMWPLLALLLGDPVANGETEQYDRPGERFARIRRELVDSLKKSTLPKEMKLKILSEIETLKKIEASVTDRWGWGAKLYGFIFPSARKARNKIAQQQLLEDLSNNALYASAARLSTLS